jgi:uncharacterized protein (TIGR02145 family)
MCLRSDIQRGIVAVSLILAVTGAGCRHVNAKRTAPNETGGRFVDARDGRVYRTVTIGGWIWFAENLAYMPHVSANSGHGGIWVYGFEGADVASATKTAEYVAFGNLYDWETALRSCPEGWHLPSDEEWRLLEIALGMTMDEANGRSWRGSSQGTRMKRGGDSGFDVVLAGWRSGDGKAAFREEHANFWTSTSVDHRAYERLFNVKRTTVGRDLGNKTAGFSVRCVRHL